MSAQCIRKEKFKTISLGVVDNPVVRYPLKKFTESTFKQALLALKKNVRSGFKGGAQLKSQFLRSARNSNAKTNINFRTFATQFAETDWNSRVKLRR